jgi:DNA polymerase (family 10)
MNLKLNEYGLFRGENSVAGASEVEVYRALGLDYIEPELREDQGELEAARTGRLPELVSVKDIRGDLHCHTDASDGHLDLEALAKAGKARGREYLAVTDHTRKVRIANGLDPKRLRSQMEAIDALNGRVRGITLLKGAEVEILDDGRLDLPDGLLSELDVVVGAIHYGLDQPRQRLMKRFLRAMDHPALNIIAHPTGRLLGEREASAVDMEALMEAARERGCVLEVNAQPARMDLGDRHCRLARELGVRVAISSDAHRESDLDLMRFGVDQARRGWLGPEQVVNTRSLRGLLRLLRRP